MTRFEARREAEKVPFLQHVTAVIDNFTTLVDSLPAIREPVRTTTSLEFFPRAQKELYYPESVANYMLTNELTGIGIDIIDEPDSATATSIEFIFDNGNTAYISRTAEQYTPDRILNEDTSMHDTLLSREGNINTIAKIPNHELNAFLFSLTGRTDEALLARYDPHGDAVVDASTMRDSLVSSAVARASDYFFELDHYDRSLYYRLTQHGSHEKLEQLTFRYETGSNRILQATIDQAQGFSLTIDAIDPTIGTQPLSPDEGDYMRLAEILNEEIVKLDLPTPIQP